MASEHSLIRDGARIAWRDFGGHGSPVLLLHGLAGHAGEWDATAAALSPSHRVIALDSRGHGNSERRPADVSRDAQVADAAAVIDALGRGPVVAIGQSVGGLTALSLAARRPDLVRGLVVAEASPAGGPAEAEQAAAEIEAALSAWPVPFASRAQAAAFFTDRFGAGAAAAWTDSLRCADGGLWPAWEIEVMVRTLHAAVREPSWEEWGSLSCPVLVVRASDGLLDPATARRMRRRLRHARLLTIPGAGHDLHLDHPEQWHRAVAAFLASTDAG